MLLEEEEERVGLISLKEMVIWLILSSEEMNSQLLTAEYLNQSANIIQSAKLKGHLPPEPTLTVL
jgi:hypothetical protein